ncbi:hypothetical protein [Gemmatimonas sp.]
MRRFRSVLLAALTLVPACAPLPPGAASPGPGVSSFEERVHVGSFAIVDAVAVSQRFVYVAGSGGVAVFDRLAERWQQPRTRDLDRELLRDIGFGISGPAAGPPITAMAGDPADDAVWIGVPGAVISYRPFTGQVQRTPITGVPQRIVFERPGAGGGLGGGDALVQSGGQWTRVSRLGLAMPATTLPASAQLVVPPTLGDLLARYPTLRAQPQLLLGADLANRPRRQFTLLAGAASPDRASELWLGTDGEGLMKVDPVFAQGADMPYGLIEPGAGALASAANGVWVASLGRSQRRGGLTFVTPDLQQWRWIDGTITVPLAGVRTFSLATRGPRAYLATDRGLVVAMLDGAQDMTAYTRLAGMPDDRVFAVQPRTGGVWAGTARGLVFVSDDSLEGAEGRGPSRRGPGRVLLEGTAVFALQALGNTLWAGTAAGLVRVAANPVDDIPAPTFVGRDAALRRAVRALATSDSLLLVATDEAVFRLSVSATSDGGVAAPGNVVAERIIDLDPLLVGEPTRLAVDSRTVVLAGRDGALLYARGSGARRRLQIPADLPGPVLDVLLQGDWLFFATPQGLVRWRRSRDGLVP